MAHAGLDTAAVVAAAASLADEQGLEAVTLTAVAATLAVRPPSLYSHVSGLQDLRARIAELAAGELAAALTDAVAGRAAGDALRAAGRAHRAWALAHPGRHAALQFAWPRQHDAVASVVVPMVAVMRGYGLEGEDAIHAVRAVRAAIYGFVALEGGGGFGMPLDPGDSFERLLDLLDDGLERLSRRS